MKNLKIIFATMVLAFSVSSCLVDDEESTAFAETDFVVGFQTTSQNESFFEDEGVVVRNYPLNVLGGGPGTPIKEDIVVTYTISSESTATEGKEFDFADNSGSLTIPAGSTFVSFPLNVNTGGFDLEVPTQLIINLTSTSTDDSVISALNDTLTVTFVGCKSQVADFSYMVRTVTAAGGLENNQIETITMTDVNVFRTATVGPFGPGARRGSIGGTEGLTFSDVCGDITIASQNLVSLYSNQVFGSGMVDPDTGDITLNYTITFGAGNVVYTSTFTRQ